MSSYYKLHPQSVICFPEKLDFNRKKITSGSEKNPVKAEIAQFEKKKPSFVFGCIN